MLSTATRTYLSLFSLSNRSFACVFVLGFPLAYQAHHNDEVTLHDNALTNNILTSLPGDILLKPIMANAGKDISHWFDSETRDVSCSVTPGADMVVCTYVRICTYVCDHAVLPVTQPINY